MQIQLFPTKLGISKYGLRPTMPALRPDLGGQPCLFISVNVRPPELHKTTKYYITIQGIQGTLIFVNIPRMRTVLFNVGSETLAEGDISEFGGWEKKPSPKEEQLRERTRRRILLKEFVKAGGKSLSKEDLKTIEALHYQIVNAKPARVSEKTINKLLGKGYIEKKGRLSTRYEFTPKGHKITNYLHLTGEI